MGQHLLFSTWILPNKILNRYSYVWKSVILGKLSFYCIWKRAGGGYAFQKFWHVHFLLFDAFVWLYYYSLYLFLDYASFQIGFLKYESNIWNYWKSKIFSLWQNVWLVINRVRIVKQRKSKPKIWISLKKSKLLLRNQKILSWLILFLSLPFQAIFSIYCVASLGRHIQSCTSAPIGDGHESYTQEKTKRGYVWHKNLICTGIGHLHRTSHWHKIRRY